MSSWAIWGLARPTTRWRNPKWTISNWTTRTSLISQIIRPVILRRATTLSFWTPLRLARKTISTKVKSWSIRRHICPKCSHKKDQARQNRRTINKSSVALSKWTSARTVTQISRCQSPQETTKCKAFLVWATRTETIRLSLRTPVREGWTDNNTRRREVTTCWALK